MNTLNLVVMGKTGAGKSTLINAVLEDDLAPTGTGQPVTTVNKVYTKKLLMPFACNRNDAGTYGKEEITLNLYDTVGLEIDKTITQKNLYEINTMICKAQLNEQENDKTMVWFCVNCRSNRFESYEFDLIRSLSIEHEIPFILILTQCYNDEQGQLERQIKRDFQGIPVIRILAKDCKLRNGTIPAYGITELLQRSVMDYNRSKVTILESKLLKLSVERKHRISQIKTVGDACIKKYTRKAEKIGYIPVGCIPFVHGLCQTMIRELNRTVGIDSSEKFAADIFANVILGLIVTPLMFIPFLSAGVANAYVETVGENYLAALMAVVEHSSDEELKNNDLIAERIKTELNKRKKDG